MTEQATLDDAEMPDCKFEVEQGLGSVGPSARGRQEEILAFILALSPACFWVYCSLSGVLPFFSRGSGVPRTGFASYILCFSQFSLNTISQEMVQGCIRTMRVHSRVVGSYSHNVRWSIALKRLIRRFLPHPKTRL